MQSSKISYKRNDFLHKQSRILVNNYSQIAVEKLNIKVMTRNHYLSKSIVDASWDKFIQLLSYKAEDAGNKLIEINPRGTSQHCICGNKVEKKLSTRIHRCNNCGVEINSNKISLVNERGKPNIDQTSRKIIQDWQRGKIIV